MCSSCQTGWHVCGCDGGDVFSVCPCTRGVSCPVCKHDPKAAYTGDVSQILNELLLPEVYKNASEVFLASQKKNKE